MKNVYAVEFKRSGGGSYAVVGLYSTLDGAKQFLQNEIEKYGNDESIISPTKIKVNINGPVYYQITPYKLEDR